MKEELIKVGRQSGDKMIRQNKNKNHYQEGKDVR
jgi:hypothetical protein